MATYTVGASGKDYTSIQSAIAARTTSGTIIEVYDDKVYAEAIASAAAGVIIRPATGCSPVIDGSEINSTTVLISHNIFFHGFTIKGQLAASNNYGLRLSSLADVGDIVIDGGQRGFYDNSSNTVVNLTVKNTKNATFLFTSSSSTRFIGRTIFRNNSGNLYISTSGNLYFSDLLLDGNTNTTGLLVMEGGTITIDFLTMIDNLSGIVYSGSGVNAINTALLLGNDRECIKTQGGAPTVNIKNFISASNGLNQDALYHSINRISGVINVSNYCSLPNPRDRSYMFNGVTDLGGGLVKSPMFVSGRKPAIVIIGSDDSGALDTYFTETIAPKLEAKGWRGTMACDVGNMNPDRWGKANALVVAGHEISSHGYHFGNKTTDMAGLSIVYSGAEATADVSISNDTMIISAPSGTTLKTITLSSFSRISALVTEINTVTGFTATKTNSDISNGWSLYLSDTAAKSVKTLAQFDYDTAKVYSGELSESKSIIEQNIPGYTCRTYTAPGNDTDIGIQNALHASGYIGARGGGTTGKYFFDDINIYSIQVYGLYSLYNNNNDPSLDDVNKYLGSILEMIKCKGGCITIYSHSDTELTADGWDKTLDLLESSGVMVMTLRDAVDYIKTNGTQVDNLNYTCTFTDQSDYHLQPTSPCIGAGTAIAGITTDIEGNQLYPPYNIGPYGAAAGALETGASDHTGQAKLSFTAVSNPTDTTFADAHTYKLSDSHQMRSVTGWEYGTENTFYNADGTPKTLTGAALKAAGIGPLLWIGDNKWLAFKSTAEAKRALKVSVA